MTDESKPSRSSSDRGVRSSPPSLEDSKRAFTCYEWESPGVTGAGDAAKRLKNYFTSALIEPLAYQNGEGGITRPASILEWCPPVRFPHLVSLGEGGIRTLGTLLGYGALAKRCFRPLSHLTIGGHRLPLQSRGGEYGG
jgi:hypothetical protein